MRAFLPSQIFMAKNVINYFVQAALILFLSAGTAFSQERQINLGFIGCLSSFAGNYGTAVLEGALLAAKELNAKGIKVNITVEDDQSVAKNTVSAFVKLASLSKIQGIIGGSWWINAIVKQAEQRNLPLVSCETLYNQETVLGKSYFLLQGDLKDWVRVYEPFIKAQGYKRGAIIRYASGFGATLADEMKVLFSKSERVFAGTIEYNDIQMSEASSIVLKLKKMNADVVYVDAQPGGLVNLLKRMAENGMEGMTIITHSVAEDVLRGKLFDMSNFKNLYYTLRTTFDKEFANKFEDEYKKKPYLNADLGYYAVYLLSEALETKDSVGALKAGLTVNEKRFNFDAKNVFSGAPQEIWRIEGGRGVKVGR